MRRKLHGLTTPGIFRALTSSAYDCHQLQVSRLNARMLAHPTGSASPNLPSASLRRISRHFPQISKHSRRHCGAGEEVKYIAPQKNIGQVSLPYVYAFTEPDQIVARSQSAETKSAFIVCILFSDSSNTFEYFDSNTSSVTSSAPDSFVTSVLKSWNAGKQ